MKDTARNIAPSEVSEEDARLLDKIKKAVSPTSDAVVKRAKDGKLSVYKNRITKLS